MRIACSRYPGVRGWLALLVIMSLAVPALLYAHIRLESSSPAREEVLTTAPPRLHLTFSASIEQRYTGVTLTAPDGSSVPLGAVELVDGSDREITVSLPALMQNGIYTVGWRTAGADGHVLEGSYAFTLALDTTQVTTPDTSEAGTPPASAPHAHAEPQSVGGARDAVARGFHFLALLIVLGAISFRVLLLPRLGLGHATRELLVRRAWRMLAAGAVLLASAAVARLWVQSIALHGAARAWNTALLSIMLSDTSWGRAWMMQALLFALLGMAIVWALTTSDRFATPMAVIAATGLAAIPALSGHAAGAEGLGRLVVLNDAVHVAAVGAWLGTLAVLLLAAIPVIRTHEPDGPNAAAAAVDRFSPLALTGAALVVLTGLINTIMHLTTPAQLWETAYGRTLLVKLLLVVSVILLGAINWRIVRPRLRGRDALRQLRISAGGELLLALLVLAATAILTGQPRP